MEKLLTKNPAYYRINLNTGNLIYLSHHFNVDDSEYIEITIKDIVLKLDEVIGGVNALQLKMLSVVKAIPSVSEQAEFETLKTQISDLTKEIASLKTLPNQLK